MKGRFRDLLRRFCLEGSALGLKYFYIYPDRISRCFWTLTLTSSLCCAGQLCWLLYSRFTDMPTRIIIENQYEPITNKPYPAITLCSPNQITISSTKHFNRTLVEGSSNLDLERILPQLVGFYKPVKEVSEQDMEHLQFAIDDNRYNMLEFLTTLPQSCDRFMKLCWFQQKKVPCHQLFAPILTTHGLCCAFNSMYHFKERRRNEGDLQYQPRKVKASSVSEAFTVVIDYEPQDALDGTLVNSAGVRILFNDWNEFPSDDESALVQPHVESRHGIRNIYTYCSDDVKDLPAKSRSCYFEDEFELKFFPKYRNTNCDHLCAALALERSCHCLPPHLPHVRSSQVCNATSLPCLVALRKQLTTTNNCSCLGDCVFRRYSVDTDVGNLDGLPYLVPNLFEGLTINFSTTILHFYFQQPVYVKQRQETVMSLISFQANLGGVVGLCTGCSVISILEIVFYAYIGIRNYVKKRLAAKRNRLPRRAQ